ncbi:hypothetical protein [Pendulispora albinea]|uniref:Uncharacterized protein n=1 Tax=Pendulispora albinea TaxID=2741071 RepID=A0ABZ2LS29_9BACT
MQSATSTSFGSQTNGKVTALDSSLDALAQKSYGELESLYRISRSPKSIRALDGEPKGRMLAARFVSRTPAGALLRGFAASSLFVWDGKSFASRSDEEGTGINRLQVPGALGRQKLFPFHTRFGNSGIDGQRAFVLDYDLPENPIWIRKIHDEVREVSPGLFFGPAMWKGQSGLITVLWFALDTGRR